MNKEIGTFQGMFVILTAIAIAVGAVIYIHPEVVAVANAQQSTDELTGWMWNGLDENGDSIVDAGVGWISLNCSNNNECGFSDYKVSVASNGRLSGYAWAGDYGWLSFNEDTVRIQGNSLTGRARFLSGDDTNDGWDGWVDFTDVNVDKQTGEITGFAWNADDSNEDGSADNGLGWFSFYEANIGGSNSNSDPFGIDFSAAPDTAQGQITPELIATVFTHGDTDTSPYDYSFKCDFDGVGEDINNWDDRINNSTNDQEISTDCTYGDDGLSGSWTAWLRVVNDNGQTEYASTNISICVPGDPLCNLAGCYATADIDGNGVIDPNEKIGSDDEVFLGDVVRWVAETAEGGGSFTFNWGGDAPLDSSLYDNTNETIDVVYETVGIKNGETQILGGSPVSCDAGFRVVIDPEFEEF